jgi:hypothetical protein
MRTWMNNKEGSQVLGETICRVIHDLWKLKGKSSLIKTSQLKLYREIMAVCSENHTKLINTVCGQNVQLLDVKRVVHIVITGL